MSDRAAEGNLECLKIKRKTGGDGTQETKGLLIPKEAEGGAGVWTSDQDGLWRPKYSSWF